MKDEKIYSELFREYLSDEEYKQRCNEILSNLLHDATTRILPSDKDLRRKLKGKDSEHD